MATTKIYKFTHKCFNTNEPTESEFQPVLQMLDTKIFQPLTNFVVADKKCYQSNYQNTQSP